MGLGTDPRTLAVPRLGRLTGVLLEAVIMLIAMAVSARWVIRRFQLKPTFGSTISMGLLALGILLPAELAGVVWVRGLSLPEYLASFGTIPGLVSLMMFLLFAAMPTLVTRAGRNRVGEIS
jgi:hypothetical protein